MAYAEGNAVVFFFMVEKHLDPKRGGGAGSAHLNHFGVCGKGLCVYIISLHIFGSKTSQSELLQ